VTLKLEVKTGKRVKKVKKVKVNGEQVGSSKSVLTRGALMRRRKGMRRRVRKRS